MPLAFEDLSPFERAEQQFRDNIRTPDDKLPSKIAKDEMKADPQGGMPAPVSDPSDIAKPTTEGNSLYGQMIVGLFGILILAFFGWLKFRKPRRS